MASFAARLGRPLMPWQRYVVDVLLEVDDAGQFVYSSATVTVPRQSGKTFLYGALCEQRAYALRGARVFFTQQSGKDARDWFLNEHVPLLRVFGDAVSVLRGAGTERVLWRRSGGLFRPFPPQPDALHGKTSDLVVVDEAWAFDVVRGNELNQAIVPTQATRRNAQVLKLSTAGDATSQWLLGTVEAGRAAVEAGRREGVAYFEWSCPDELDPCEPSSWALFHPAYGRTIDDRAMHAALELLGPDEFARAYGNRWVSMAGRVIPLAAWRAVQDPDAPMPTPGQVALAFDVALDRSDAAICAAWRDDAGMAHLEVADYQPGVGWLAERAAELVERWHPVAFGYDAAGPALDVADVLKRHGLELEGLAGKEYAAACAGLLEGITAERPGVRIRPHPALDAAAGAAARRSVADAWAWGRRQSSTSIATLTAATVALWSYDHAPAALGPFRVY